MLIYSNLRFPPINSDSETHRDKRLSAGVLARLSGKHTLPISGGWSSPQLHSSSLPPSLSPSPWLLTTGLLFCFVFFISVHSLMLSLRSPAHRLLGRKRRSSKTAAGKLVSCGERRLGRRFEVGTRHLRPLAVGEERERERGTPNS